MNDTLDKFLVENDQFFYEDPNTKKIICIKQDSELFDEEKYVPGKIVRVSRKFVEDMECWFIFIDDKEHLVIKSYRLNNSEKNFLRTKEGISFLIDKTKLGYKSFSQYRNDLKEIIP